MKAESVTGRLKILPTIVRRQTYNAYERQFRTNCLRWQTAVGLEEMRLPALARTEARAHAAARRQRQRCSAPAGNRSAPAWSRLVALSAIIGCLTMQAGPLPQFSREIPEQFRGEYRSFAETNRDHAGDRLTNAPFFGTIMSDQVVLAGGQVRRVEGLMLIKRPGGATEYVLFFPDNRSWLVKPTDLSSRLVVAERQGHDSKRTTTFILDQRATTTIETNGAAANLGNSGPQKNSRPKG
jgi:hypothetical protein